jgi:transposase
LPRESQTFVLREYLSAVDQAAERVRRLETELAELAQTGPQAPLIAALQCLRGVALVTAASLAAEIGEIARFPRPRPLMGYAGLVSAEHSSGSRRRQGGITKAGNHHLRGVLIEAAWHYQHRPGTSKALLARQRGQAETVKRIADRAQDRLHRRYWRLIRRGKPTPKAAVAVARELLGFIWAIAREVQNPRSLAATAA